MLIPATHADSIDKTLSDPALARLSPAARNVYLDRSIRYR